MPKNRPQPLGYVEICQDIKFVKKITDPIPSNAFLTLTIWEKKDFKRLLKLKRAMFSEINRFFWDNVQRLFPEPFLGIVEIRVNGKVRWVSCENALKKNPQNPTHYHEGDKDVKEIIVVKNQEDLENILNYQGPERRKIWTLAAQKLTQMFPSSKFAQENEPDDLSLF